LETFVTPQPGLKVINGLPFDALERLAVVPPLPLEGETRYEGLTDQVI